MSKEIVVNAEENQTRIAIVEDGKIAELYIENPDNKRTIGNMYLGRVRKVMPSIQAAFVDIGQEQDAFLHFSDVDDNLELLLKFLSDKRPRISNIDVPEEEMEGKYPAQVLNRGQNLLVQVSKEPISNKGSRITTSLSMAGRFLVLVPLGNYVAVSRKITEQKERRRLEALAKSLVPDGFGAIVRTVAQGRDAKSLDTDLKLLLERWKRVEKRLANQPSPPTLIHEDVDMASSIIRDQFSSDFERILVDNKGLYHSVKTYVGAVAPKMANRVELHESSKAVFKEAGIQSGADKAFRDRVELPSGGYLYIEQTEAMHVVDVNSGRSGRGMSQEENSLKVDLEAARVIAHQVRLRDLGGIIVIDFIDLRSGNNRRKIHDELKKCFKDDRAVTKILPMSDFGLVEITRQRLRPSITTTFSPSNGDASDSQYTPDDISQREYEQAMREYKEEIKRLRKKANRTKAKSPSSQPSEKAQKQIHRLKSEIGRLKHDLEQATQKAKEAEEKARAEAQAKAEAEASAQQARKDAEGGPAREAPKKQVQQDTTTAAAGRPAKPPAAMVRNMEDWLRDFADRNHRRTVTLEVHPFTAAFLNRPVPSYTTQWFMDHLVRVHIKPNEDLSPLTYRFVDRYSGEPMKEHTLVATKKAS